MGKKEIMVSVWMLVYNHEEYVIQAIEGVLMQQTNFKFELIIGEDCSSDGSRRIVEDYEKKYPDIIKVIYQPVNRGGVANGKSVCRKAKGKYWAICEGDDYWTDKHKLQKQIDFLESHPAYSAVYHNVVCVDKKGRPCKRKRINKYPHKAEQSYTIEMLRGIKLAGQTASLVCRNVYAALGTRDRVEVFEKCDCNDDQKMCMVLACVGKIYFMENEMACHRVILNEGTSYSASVYNKNTLFQVFYQYLELCNMINKLFQKDISSADYEKAARIASLSYAKREPTVKNLMVFLKIEVFSLLNYVNRIINHSSGKY